MNLVRKKKGKGGGKGQLEREERHSTRGTDQKKNNRGHPRRDIRQKGPDPFVSRVKARSTNGRGLFLTLRNPTILVHMAAY